LMSRQLHLGSSPEKFQKDQEGVALVALVPITFSNFILGLNLRKDIGTNATNADSTFLISLI
jgi:hypothetical protein